MNVNIPRIKPPSVCASCKFWEEVEHPPSFGWNADDNTPKEMPGRWGSCTRILHLSGDSHSDIPSIDSWHEPTHGDVTKEIAYLADGSAYFANLATKEDFGCVLWAEGPCEHDWDSDDYWQRCRSCNRRRRGPKNAR